MIKTLKRAVAGAVLALALGGAAQAEALRIGGKNYTEQLLIAEITAQLLEAHGHEVEKLDGMGTSVVRAAQENGQVDIYWEYTGTSLITFNKVQERLSAEATYAKVKDLDAQVGITWLNPSQANSTYAIAVRGDDDMGLSTISDMAAAYNAGEKLKFGVNAEFPKRPDGLIGMQEVYGFKAGRANLAPMQTGLIYDALKSGSLDIGMVIALDGRIPAFGFKVLEDDKGFFPNYAMTPTIRTEVLEAHPEVGDLLNRVSALLNDDSMRALNARVDVDRNTIEAVATAFLTEQGLI